jgi:hypothetical protein
MKTSKILFSAVIALVSIISFASPAFAEDKTPGSGPSPYTDCGIGAALFTDTHWAAVTSNVIFDLGITALISATASPQTCSGKKKLAALFIRDTYSNLAEETAAGQGEHLATVLNIFGCESSHQLDAVQEIRNATGQAVSVSGYADQAQLDKAANFYLIVESAVKKHCSV